MLQGAIDEAVLAVDLYNQPREPRRLEAFFVHMHIAWLYLLHAEFTHDGIDYRYRLPNGRFERVDGEPKTWELARSAKERWDDNHPVRKNLELSVGLRNRIEHRYHEATTIATAGYAQALLLNFEEELTTNFGADFSLGEVLRFPIFVGTITALGKVQNANIRSQLPKDTREFIARFESGLDDSVMNDQHYEFRINLVPKLGSKTDADTSMTFVREADLSEEEKAALVALGKSGQVVVREQTRPVASRDYYRPGAALKLVEGRIPFKLRLHDIVIAWHKLGCRPEGNAANPERTDARYCVYDLPHRDYLYTKAFIDKLTRELATEKKFRTFLDREPVVK
jgi:Protein of unknown function (DUF3644)